MRTIRAAVCHAFNTPLSVEQVTIAAPGPGEVEVDLSVCAICHSDISYADGAWGGKLPAVYGHEAAGHVTRVGDGVRHLAPGQPVIVTLLRNCGTCPSCAKGESVYCGDPPEISGPLTTADGGPLVQSMNCGAFAEAVVVHHSQIAPIPADMPMEAAALLACGVITGVGAVVNTAQVRVGQSVVVIGAGGVGLNAIQGARIAGAARIIAIDLNAEKLDMAREFGATHGLNATEPEPWRAVQDLTGGRGADHVFVTVGAISAFDSAPRLLAPGGKVYMVGMPHSGATTSFEPVILSSLGQGMIGTKMGDTVLGRDIPWMIDLYQQGRLKLDELVSARWPLDQINEAIADTKAGRARRNVIVF